MTKDKALKIALDALEKMDMVMKRSPDTDKAITAIKEALAHCPDCGKAVGDAGHIHTCSPQPKQEPVVWMYQDKISHAVKFQKHMSDFVDHSRWYETPLYTKEQL